MIIGFLTKSSAKKNICYSVFKRTNKIFFKLLKTFSRNLLRINKFLVKILEISDLLSIKLKKL